MAARRRQTPGSLIVGISQREQKLIFSTVGSMLATRDGRRALLIIAIAALLCIGGDYLWYYELRPRHPVGPTVRIATWNLRQFSPARKGVDLRAIADVIQSNHFEIVA